MTTRGKLIAIEGIDGSGKRTQLELLARALESRGIECVSVSFPRYDSSFGQLVAQYLNGDFGPLSAVDPHFSAMLYAGDRLEAKPELDAALSAGKTVLADRYIASNLAHQTARVAPEQRLKFLHWLQRLEYSLYDLPAEDLVLFLRLPVTEAHRLVGMKQAREYTALRRDLQEADVRHLEEAAYIYESLAATPTWAAIECVLQPEGALLAPEAIHAAVLAAVDARLPNLTHHAKGAR
jgi:dTMP kinase